MNLSFFTTAAFLISYLVSAAENDPCARLGKLVTDASRISVSQVSDCYLEFPLTDQMRNQTFNVLEKVLDMYAFMDLVNDSPDKELQPNYDLLGALAEVRERKYKLDFRLQQALERAFVPVNDGHLAYKSQCYRGFAFLQPFFLGVRFNEQAQMPRIYINSIDENYQKVMGVNLTQYLGAQVLQIEEREAVHRLERFMENKWGTSKDSNTRFNRAIASQVWDISTSTYMMSRGAFSGRNWIPEEDNIKWTLRLAETTTRIDLDIPWQVKPSNDLEEFSSRDQYWDLNCKSKNEGNLESVRRPREEKVYKPLMIIKEEIVPQKQLKSVGGIESSTNMTAIATGPGFGFFMASSKTGVLVISEFRMPGETWKTSLIAGFQELEKRKAENLILDFSNNSGGVICTAYAFLQLLIPNRVKPFLTDMRLSPVLSQLIKSMPSSVGNSFFLPNKWNQANGKPFTSLSWIEPPRTRQKTDGSPMTAKYTQLFSDICPFSWDKFTLPFDTKNIILLTNGYCVSSCAIVHHQLYEFAPEIETMVVTAFNKTTATVSSTAGGQAYRASYIDLDLADAKLNKDISLKLPEKSDVYFTMRGAYSYKLPGKMLEYIRRESNKTLRWNSEVHKIWRNARQSKGWN